MTCMCLLRALIRISDIRSIVGEGGLNRKRVMTEKLKYQQDHSLLTIICVFPGVPVAANMTRQLIRHAEIWGPDIDKCLYTMIFWAEDTTIYYTKHLGRENTYDLNTLSTESSHVVPQSRLDRLCVPWDSRFTNVDPAVLDRDDIHIKRPIILGYHPSSPKDADGTGTRDIGLEYDYCNQAREILAFEALKLHPHPSIAEYFGCIKKDGRANGIVTRKYHRSLFDAVERQWGAPIDVDKVYAGVERALGHLHSLGMIFGNISPGAIRLDENGEPVLVDMRLCGKEGEVRPEGSDGACFWTRAPELGGGTFEKTDDFFGMSLMRRYLNGERSTHETWPLTVKGYLKVLSVDQPGQKQER